MIQSREISLVDITKLVPCPKNNNIHSQEQIDRLAKLIEFQGFRNPIVVSNRSGFVVAGHGRIEAARKLKMDKLPVMYQDFESEAQEYAYLTSDNAIASWAELDLSMVNTEMLDFGPDFDIDLLGIKDFVIEPVEKFDPQSDEDAVPEVVHPITRKGDLWLLGNHRLLCGDSTMIDDVEKLLNGQSPNTMITDPPYGVKYEAGWRAEAKGVKKTEREESSNLQNDDRSDWYDSYVLHKGNIAYVWHASFFTDVVMDGLKRAGFEIKAQIIWNKNVHALSRSDYQWKHEPCWYGIRKGANHNWLGDRKQKTVWDIQNVMFEKDGGGKTSHPTQKPVALYVNSINNHTNSGEYIYEPFGGSGTSIIAAEKTSRRSLTIELDEKYCDVIIKRWEAYTGKKATLELTNQTYEELKVERDGTTN
jgi:DNA modification methylase